MSRLARRVVMFGAPLATAAIVAFHPADPATAADLGAQTDLYIGIHVGLLFMLPLLGMTVWFLLDGIENRAATVARITLPFMLVFYAAFDALVGIGAGLLAREALTFGGAESAGAQALAARWMEIPFPIPITGALGPTTWLVTLGAAAIAHYRAGSSILVVVGLALAAPLFGFGHSLISGPIGMAGLLVAVAVHERSAHPNRRPAPEASSA
jgi:hypothetical protein